MTTLLAALADGAHTTATVAGPAGTLLLLPPLLLLIVGAALAEPGGATIRWTRIERGPALATGGGSPRPPTSRHGAAGWRWPA